MECGNAGLESEALNDGGGPTRLHIEIGQKPGMALTFEALDKAEHGSF